MMESLSETAWDVVISGTGLQQSLLALALSRSSKKVLHLDSNDYYGGAEAAFSLQEIEDWVKKSLSDSLNAPFFNASFWKPDPESSNHAKLSFPRAYTLSLSPQLIYSRSKLLAQLISSKVYKQLEFQAVGNWWIYDPSHSPDNPSADFKRVPNGREDIFTDRSIDVRAKRTLMKFLRFVVEYEEHREVWSPHAETALSEFLSSQFQIPPSLHNVILALTLSLKVPSEVTVQYALPRIARHLTSIGVFGPGFGAVLPKWGGGSEIAQVACRAGAVGGGVYVLDTSVTAVEHVDSQVHLSLSNHESIRTKRYIVSRDHSSDFKAPGTLFTAKLIAVVSSDLSGLFVSTVEGAPISAVSPVGFPSGSLEVNGGKSAYPTYVMVHSSDTGECPSGQIILYASTLREDHAKDRLEAAIEALISSPIFSPPDDQGTPAKTAQVLNKVYYEQGSATSAVDISEETISFPSSSLDLAFDDTTLDHVETAWRNILGDESRETDYMVFQEREGMNADEDEAEDI